MPATKGGNPSRRSMNLSSRWSLLGGFVSGSRDPLTEANVRRMSHLGVVESFETPVRRPAAKRVSSAGAVRTTDPFDMTCASACEFDRLRANLGLQDDRESLDLLFLRICSRNSESDSETDAAASETDLSNTSDTTADSDGLRTPELSPRRPLLVSSPSVPQLLHLSPPPVPKRSPLRPTYEPVNQLRYIPGSVPVSLIPTPSPTIIVEPDPTPRPLPAISQVKSNLDHGIMLRIPVHRNYV